MHRIYAVAINTFREAVRDRVLYAVLGLACAILLFTLSLAELSLNEERRVVADVGLASISFFSVVMAVFLGSSLLYKEIERKTLYVMLPKPIAREEFLIGKFFGIVLTASVFIALMGGVQFWVASIQSGAKILWVACVPLMLGAVGGLLFWKMRDRTRALALLAPLVFGSFLILAAVSGVLVQPMALGMTLFVGEVALLTAIALLFSSFSTPFLTGALTLGVWLVGRSAGDMAVMKSRALSPAIRAFVRGLSHVVPNFNLYVPGRYALEEGLAKKGGVLLYTASTFGYTLLYVTVIMAFAAVIFRRRDLI